MTYNGTVPGPTIIAAVGHETLIRFNNKINGTYFKGTYSPCDEAGRTGGRPISVHHHGSASLAPFDGWADDELCTGETKDYVIPNNRPTTAWYHDHGLHITRDNAYYGLAANYWMSAKKAVGGCGAPWNLDNIPELPFTIADKVLDKQCQLLNDELKAHTDNLYGDINLVNGIPFPLMNLKAQTYRFRFLVAGPTRPYLVQFRNELSQSVGHNFCKVIGADGGYRFEPAPFPTDGLLIGVAERWDVVCNFAGYAGKTLYVWNGKDEQQMAQVPYFCHSHLLAKIVFDKVAPVNPPVLNTAITSPTHKLSRDRPLDAIRGSDIQQAMALIRAGKPHRDFKFGRTGSQWTINGETWDTLRIAAADVGQNTWEVWKFTTGGGWFHPVHVHLVDFLLIQRDGAQGLRTYESFSPKDVMYLGPGNTVYVIARFGPHKGDYMFHCHNLVHEDNDMMRAFSIIDSSKGKNAASAQQYVINPLNRVIYDNYAYSDPMVGKLSSIATPKAPVWNQAYVDRMLAANFYRIFYPTPEDKIDEYNRKSLAKHLLSIAQIKWIFDLIWNNIDRVPVCQ